MTSLWSSLTVVFLGFWLMSAPYSFGYSGGLTACSDLVCGILFVFLGWLCRQGTRTLLPWIGAVVALWVQAAPIIFWEPKSACYLNDTLVGVLATALFVIVPSLPGGTPDQGPSIPPGWTYNPSAWAQRIPILALVGICWFFSRVLAAFQLGYIDTLSDPFFEPGTTAVLTSSLARSFPISDAGLGTFMYSLEFLFLLHGGERRWRTVPWMTMLSGFLVVPVSAVSVLLVILQPLGVGTWCSFCLLIALCALFTIPLGVDELVATIQYVMRSGTKSFWRRVFWGGDCPGAKEDTRTPPPSASLLELVRASLWGVTLPWNLVCCALLGVVFLFLPSLYQSSDAMLCALYYVMGIITIAGSVIACSEFLRGVRWILCFLALCFFGVQLWCTHEVNVLAALFCLLSIRRGATRERTSI